MRRRAKIDKLSERLRSKVRQKREALDFQEHYPVQPGHARGVIEFIIKDKNGHVVDRRIEKNIVKIFAKEMLAHRLPSSEIWDPEANSGIGDWIDSGIDPDEEFAARYILFGASFDENGVPLDDDDPRFYTSDIVTGTTIPIQLTPGAEFEGGLINAIPIAEPERPLLRVENIDFEPTFQPSGTPFLDSDVRAINNIVLLETTLRLDEYNGFGLTNSDFFTITEVALAGGKRLGTIGTCEKTPRELFLEGSSDGDALLASIVSSGSDIVSLDPSEAEVDLIKEGDQIKIVASGETAGGTDDTLGQINPFYLVLSKQVGGRDIQLDRVPLDSSNNPISGAVGLFRDSLKIFSHRILATPLKKSIDFEILTRWRIIFA